MSHIALGLVSALSALALALAIISLVHVLKSGSPHQLGARLDKLELDYSNLHDAVITYTKRDRVRESREKRRSKEPLEEYDEPEARPDGGLLALHQVPAAPTRRMLGGR